MGQVLYSYKWLRVDAVGVHIIQANPWDVSSKEECRLMLFVIDNNTTGASLCVEAAHAIIKRQAGSQALH